MMPQASARPWLAAIGALGVWMLYFIVVYAVHSIGCVRGWTAWRLLGADALTFSLAALTIATLGAIAYTGWWGYRASRAARAGDAQHVCFAAVLTTMVSGLALVSTIWVGLPIVMVPACQ